MEDDKVIKVIITTAVDDNISKGGIKLILETDPEIEVVGFASNNIELLELCKRLTPDLVILDLPMPGCKGIENTQLIKKYNKSTKVIILTTNCDDESIASAFLNGVDGYLLKSIGQEELISAIKNTKNGLTVVQQNVFGSVLNHLNLEDISNRVGKDIQDINLSKNEISIIRLIVQGKSNKDIATSIHLSEGRVRNIITKILNKFSLNDRIQLAVFAVKNNLT